MTPASKTRQSLISYDRKIVFDEPKALAEQDKLDFCLNYSLEIVNFVSEFSTQF